MQIDDKNRGHNVEKDSFPDTNNQHQPLQRIISQVNVKETNLNQQV